jgi:hypothetical protein
MVAPLFVLSLLWERIDWGSTRLFHPRSVSLRLGPIRRTVTGTALASGVLLLLMGVGTLVVGLTTDGMPASTGWQADVSLWLQGVGNQVENVLGWMPGWAAALLLLVVVALLARRALRQVAPVPESEASWPDERSDDDEPADGAGRSPDVGQLAASAANGQADRPPERDYA